ncbi:hypothetical protein V3481_008638 [Fusarium oxysporum f. sp. vasinfectum]
MHLTTEETRELSVNKVTDTILLKLKIMNCEDFYVYMIDTNFNKFVRNPGRGSQGWIPSPSQGSRSQVLGTKDRKQNSIIYTACIRCWDAARSCRNWDGKLIYMPIVLLISSHEFGI